MTTRYLFAVRVGISGCKQICETVVVDALCAVLDWSILQISKNMSRMAVACLVDGLQLLLLLLHASLPGVMVHL